MKPIHFVMLVLCIFPAGISAQVLHIKDMDTGMPVEQASLASESPAAYVVTNKKGEANLALFKGAQRIEIRVEGYKWEELSYAQLEEKEFVLYLIKESIRIDEIVVSGSRWNEISSNVPSKVSTISPKEIALQNPQTAADLLAISGKVFIQKSQQGGGSPMIRGFATNRLIYTVDGVRMNTAIFRGGNIQNVISLDPFTVQRAEVLFGPGSAIYGSDAIGGTMSFNTLTPQFSLEDEPLITGKGIARYSSANKEFTGHFDVNIGWKKWALVSSVSANDFGDLRMGRFGPDEYLRPFYVQRIDSTDVAVTNEDPRVQRPSGYSQMNLMQKVRFAPNNKWDFQYGFHYSETSDYSRYDRQIRYRNGLPRYGEWSYGPQIWMMNHLNITHTANNQLYDQMTIRLAHQFFEESRISRDINKNERENRVEEVLAYSANFDFVKAIGGRHKLFYGAEVVWNDVTSKGTNEDISTGIITRGATRYPQSTWSSVGLYVSDQFSVSKQLMVQASARYNLFALNADFDTTFYPFPFTEAAINNDALTGSIGLVFRPDETWVISSNVSTAFRAPNVDDVGKVFDSEPGAVVVPNPELDAEYAYNADLGIAKVFGNALKLDVSAYYTVLLNALVRRDFLLNGADSILYDGELSRVQAIQNAAVAKVSGVQFGARVKLPAGFGVSTDFNYQVGEEELDDGTVSPSRHAAPWFGVSRLSYSANRLQIEFNAQYSGGVAYEDLPLSEQAKTEIYAIDQNGNTYSPSWYTVNFKASYAITDLWFVSAGVENITDQRYRTYSSGIAAPGRNFILSLRTSF